MLHKNELGPDGATEDAGHSEGAVNTSSFVVQHRKIQSDGRQMWEGNSHRADKKEAFVWEEEEKQNEHNHLGHSEFLFVLELSSQSWPTGLHTVVLAETLPSLSGCLESSNMLERSLPIRLCSAMKSDPKLQKIEHPAVGM